MSKFGFFAIDHSRGFQTIFWPNFLNSKDLIVRNRQVSAKAIGLNFLGNRACAALNWVLRSVAQGFLRFVSFENISFENKQYVNKLIRI